MTLKVFASDVVRLAAFLVPPAMVGAEETSPHGRQYEQVARPLLQRYCHECHADDVTEADIDLAAFDSLEAVRKQTKTWSKVRHMLESGQMPPKDAEQPSDDERQKLATWVREFLTAEARANAGDPGPVMLRRLSNAEYTYTLRDLTGVETLDPAREFPIDGAAGEGFTNVGNGQGMSPALVQKYLDAAKSVADHAVITPTGIRFSPHTTRRDQTDEYLAQIQAFYRRYTKDGGGAAVNLQGIRFDTNQGGLLPLERYLAATLAEREALLRGEKKIEDVARERSLSKTYLALLWKVLQRDPAQNPSSMIDQSRESWREAKPGDAGRLAGEIEAKTKPLWKFNSVGHIGRNDGPKMWMEPLTSPVVTQQELRLKLPDAPNASQAVLYIAASALSDKKHGILVLKRPRIEFPAAPSGPRPPILLRDIRAQAMKTNGAIASDAARTKQYLAAVVQADGSPKSTEEIAREMGLSAMVLENWAARVRLGERHNLKIEGLFTEKLNNAQHKAIRGWGSSATPCLLTNSSQSPITLGTLTVPARGVTLHPSPTVEAIIVWRSPIAGAFRIEGHLADADNKCGNGAAWRLEWNSAAGARVLASGVIDNGGNATFNLDEVIKIAPNESVSLIINARDESHVCDTTHVALKLVEVDGQQRSWDLASDIVDNVHHGNPLPDAHGHEKVWHFASSKSDSDKPRAEPVDATIPPDSALARWRAAVVDSKPAAEIDSLADQAQKVLTAEDAAKLAAADVILRQRMLGGIDVGRFGKHPGGLTIDAADLCMESPQVLQIQLPAELCAGGHFVATAVLPATSGDATGVQIQALTEKPASLAVSPTLPILVSPGDGPRPAELAQTEFRDLFPPALCYARIVPVDEVVTLKIFYREDEHFRRLMLDEQQVAELDRLWDELFFVSQEPLQLAVSLEQIAEFAAQDNPAGAKAFAAMREPINDRAEAFRRRMFETEPAHVTAVVDFAHRARRRPLSNSEEQTLRALYAALRENDIDHEQAIRLTLARVLTSPAFLYKLEQPAPGERSAPVTDLELATRLSYFLWSSQPDETLRIVAVRGELSDDAELLKQMRRMLDDSKTRRLAIQFACQWLHVRDFDQNGDKNEKLYPQFAALRGDMYEETVQFFADMIRSDGSILDMLDANHTFVNAALAKHYGLKNPTADSWQRVAGVREQGRGGVLAMASVLASQSGASRTSPILRGNWIYETLLGERLPRPPANVPQLPETVPENLTARQLIERHSSNAACAKCHARIDPYGFALEQYDAIGRLRSEKADTKTTLFDGKSIEGIDGLRDYLLNQRRDDFIRHFCRRLLGYALGRELQLSDEPLLAEMQEKLNAHDYRFSVAIESIVTSRQFRDIRGVETTAE